ncbi:hypothetical protein KAT24_02465 [Candidatus Pacearchaeota archaeon]|nr:hypothetical protein [Candidatus Pacearchaeota archaeon]
MIEKHMYYCERLNKKVSVEIEDREIIDIDCKKYYPRYDKFPCFKGLFNKTCSVRDEIESELRKE